MRNRPNKLDNLWIVIVDREDKEDCDEYLYWMKALNMLLCCDRFVFNGVEVFANKIPERNTVSFYDKIINLRTKVAFSKGILGLVVEVDQVVNMKKLIKESLGDI